MTNHNHSPTTTRITKHIPYTFVGSKVEKRVTSQGKVIVKVLPVHKDHMRLNRYENVGQSVKIDFQLLKKKRKSTQAATAVERTTTTARSTTTSSQSTQSTVIRQCIKSRDVGVVCTSSVQQHQVFDKLSQLELERRCRNLEKVAIKNLLNNNNNNNNKN